MAMLIVDRFEVVNVTHHQRERPPVTHRTRDFPRPLVLEVAPVTDPRQLIDGGQEPVVRDRGLQGGGEADDSAGNRQVCPELLAAAFLRHYIVRAGPQPLEGSGVLSGMNEYHVNG